MVQWIDPSWGGPIELFLVPVSAPRLLWYVLSCLWDGAYKRTLAAIRKQVAVHFLSRYLNGTLPDVRRHITVTECVECIVELKHFLTDDIFNQITELWQRARNL